MYHSINFGEKNTWSDWHLVPSSRPVFNPPSLKERYLDIPGGDGAIDLTEALTGYPVFNNRTGSLEFIVMNDYWPWTEAYSTICDYLHGRKMRAVLEDDSEYYYEGRFKVNRWKSDKAYSLITIDYTVAPYKKRLSPTVINMVAGTDNNFSKYTITSDQYGIAPQCPKINVRTPQGVEMTLKFKNETLGILTTKTLSAGEQYFPDLVLYGDSVSCSVKVSVSTPYSLELTCEYGRL